MSICGFGLFFTGSTGSVGTYVESSCIPNPFKGENEITTTRISRRSLFCKVTILRHYHCSNESSSVPSICLSAMIRWRHCKGWFNARAVGESQWQIRNDVSGASYRAFIRTEVSLFDWLEFVYNCKWVTLPEGTKEYKGWNSKVKGNWKNM